MHTVPVHGVFRSQVYEDMRKAGCAPDEATWLALISAHTRSTRKGPGSMADVRVMRVVELMQAGEVCVGWGLRGLMGVGGAYVRERGHE